MARREDYVISIYGVRCVYDEVGVRMYEEDARRIKDALKTANLYATGSDAGVTVRRKDGQD